MTSKRPRNKTKKKTKTPSKKQTVTTGTYNKWVHAVRAVEIDARRVVINLYHLLKDGQKKKLWKHGPYRNFQECLMYEFGISAARWNGLQQTITRFGEDTVEAFGYESCVTMLRLPPKSPEEKSVFQEIAEKTQKYGGRAPSSDAVARVVAKYVPSQKPVDATPTIVERLREELRAVKVELRATRVELRKAQAELKKKAPRKRKVAA